MKTYILQKDLPDVKAGEVLSWGEAINAYYIPTKTPTIECKYKWSKHIVENDDGTWFKEKKEEKPTARVNSNLWIEDFKFIQFNLSIEGKPDTTPIKISTERLAEILIAERAGHLTIGVGWMERMYTEKELLEAEEKAWDAARDIEKFLTDVKYQTFSDYKNEIK